MEVLILPAHHFLRQRVNKKMLLGLAWGFFSSYYAVCSSPGASLVSHTLSGSTQNFRLATGMQVARFTIVRCMHLQLTALEIITTALERNIWGQHTELTAPSL